MTIKDGDKVKLHYTGKLSDGTVFDSNVGKEPFEFEVGSGMVIKGFDSGVRDMKIGSKKTIHIPVVEGYGEYIEDLVKEYPVETLNGAQVTPGQTVFMEADDGRKFPCQIKEITEENIIADFNHPLAGKDLTFDLELLEVN